MSIYFAVGMRTEQQFPHRAFGPIRKDKGLKPRIDKAPGLGSGRVRAARRCGLGASIVIVDGMRSGRGEFDELDGVQQH